MFWQKKTIIIGGPVLVALLLALGLYDRLFHTTEWYDIFMHSLTGGLFTITVAGTGWHVWLKRRRRGRIGLGIRIGLLAGLFLASIFWETLEVMFNMTPNWTTSVSDTVSDVIWAQLGGIIALCFMRSPRDSRS